MSSCIIFHISSQLETILVVIFDVGQISKTIFFSTKVFIKLESEIHFIQCQILFGSIFCITSHISSIQVSSQV